MTVDGEILAAAAAAPARVALSDAVTGRALTFGQLADGVRRVAAGLAQRGVGRGDVVALVAGNSPEYAVAAYGALAAGAAVASANPRLTGSELARFFAAARPRLVLADVPVPDPGAPVARSVAELLAPPSDAGRGRSPDDPAFLFCSSGTSGLPKLARHTHAGACAFLRGFAAVDAVRLGPADVVAPAVPFTHLYGTAVVTHALRAGARVVTVPLAPEPLIAALAAHGVTAAFVSPPAMQALARHPRPGELSALRRVFSSAAPLAPELREAVAERLGCPVTDCVGMTEAWGFTADGRLLPGLEARIADPATGHPCPAGVAGELWLRGPQVMTGYHDGSGIDAGGWLRSGDLCALDADGRLTVLDRLKDLIKSGAYSVSPVEVEAELLLHADVADVAVVGHPDPELGEAPVAFAVLRPGAEPDAVRRWLVGRIAPWKQVREVIAVDAVPRNPAGKLLRRQLRAPLSRCASSARRETPSLP